MKILVTGNDGYVGKKLCPALGMMGYGITGCDWMVHHDIRDARAIREVMDDCAAVIHLANISNDPSFDLAPGLAKSVNWDCFPMMIEEAAKAGVKRFIFASSSSVYGVKKTTDVTEDLPLEPLTEYSKYKAMCEDYLIKHCPREMEFVIARPATVCGYSPSMRLDLLVNIFTHHAWRHGIIKVHGGDQYRPNIHIDDMVDAYIALLEAPASQVDGQIFNIGCRNLTLLETAEMVKGIVGRDVDIDIEESRDPRSYHVNSDKIRRVLGFECKRTIEGAIREMVKAFEGGLIPEPDDDRYYRVKQIKKMEMA